LLKNFPDVPPIDLNCDLGEGAGWDAELMPLVTSANIACGAHAGDEKTMRETVRLAVACNVSVGAHPGFNDRAHFGRKEHVITPESAAELVRFQTRALADMAGDKLRHVKLHGALYHQVSRDPRLAEAVAEMLNRLWPRLALFALAGSELWRAARRRSMPVASEVFVDRTYQRDGTLTPRSHPDALITDEEVAVTQALRMVCEGVVRATDGTEIPLVADTICLHGDVATSVAFAKRLNRELRNAGIELRPFRP
jgi:UPF0271 protein